MAKPEILETTLPNGEIGNVGYISLSEDTKMTVYSDYLINNKVYTLSFYAKNTSTDGTKLEIIDGIRDGIATYLVTQEWNKVKLTFISNGKDVVVYFPSSDYYLYALKLEEGNTATTWTPSENDTKAETLQSARIQYYKSTSATSMVGGEWSTVTPTWESGYYIWTRTMFIHQDGSILYSSPACMTGEKGDKGDNGMNGTSSYTHIKYSVNSSGNPMVDNPTDSTPYIGVYIGTSSTAPTSYTDYVWSRYKGQDGTNGTNGTNGNDGISIVSVTPIYYCKSTATKPATSTLPTGNTKVTTDSATTYNAWNLRPATWTTSYKYYFICSQIEYSNGTIGFSSIVQDNSLSKCVTEIITNTNNIGLKVSQGTCIADINASIASGQSSVKISADAINLNGYATINDYFHVDTNGKLHCKDAEITDGTINIKTSTESQSAISLNYQTAQNATMTNEMSSYGNRYQLNLPNNGGWSAGELNNNELILANQQDANNYYGLYATVGGINKSTVNTADFLTLSGTYNGTYNEYYKLKANGEMTATSVKTTSGANLDSVKTKVDGNLKSTLFGNAQGTSSAYPSVDISSIPTNTRIRIEVGVPIDNSGTIGWFAYSTIKSSATTDYLLNIGGYYYSSTYNGSIFVNLSNTRITINNSWTKIIGGTANTTVTNLKSLSRIYVYTENL